MRARLDHDDAREGHAARLTIAVTGVAVALAVSACASDAWPARTPFPLPRDVATLPLSTAPAAGAKPPGAVWACESGRYVPVQLVWDRARGTASFVNEQGTAIELIWPRGFALRAAADRVDLVAPDGSAVARDGMWLSDLGGGGGQVCQVNGVLYPPAN